MSSIVIVDTTILLNILDVPGRNQHRNEVLDRLSQLIDEGDHLFIPMVAVVEAGNHIAQVANGSQRRSVAERFVSEVRNALTNQAPWKPINFPSSQEVMAWLDEFPESAGKGIGIGDLAIKKEWEACCQRFPMSRVWVWTLDSDLAGLDRRVRRSIAHRR